MKLDSARGLKRQCVDDLLVPFALVASGARARGVGDEPRALATSAGRFGVAARRLDAVPAVQRSVALGIGLKGREYRLAVRVQRQALMGSPLVSRLVDQARGEADVRFVGRIEKRWPSAKRALGAAGGTPWYRQRCRPLLIGASVGHVKVTAGTLGAFVKRGGKVHVLSNNHVLADEDRAKTGDAVVQQGIYDGGQSPRDRAARLRHWVRFTTGGANLVDAALAQLDAGVEFDTALLRGLREGADGRLGGLGPAFLDEGDAVYKVGRTTGPTSGRVTAFELDNVVVSYDIGNLRFDDQIEIEGAGDGPFSDGGDSGSLIVNDEMLGVGLLFAGGDQGGSNGLGLTYANPLGTVLKSLKATLMH